MGGSQRSVWNTDGGVVAGTDGLRVGVAVVVEMFGGPPIWYGDGDPEVSASHPMPPSSAPIAGPPAFTRKSAGPYA